MKEKKREEEKRIERKAGSRNCLISPMMEGGKKFGKRKRRLLYVLQGGEKRVAEIIIKGIRKNSTKKLSLPVPLGWNMRKKLA